MRRGPDDKEPDVSSLPSFQEPENESEEEKANYIFYKNYTIMYNVLHILIFLFLIIFTLINIRGILQLRYKSGQHSRMLWHFYFIFIYSL
jgi:hypothetical protein